MFIVRRLVLALQTLTRIPLPVSLKLRPRDVPGAIAFYPFAGVLAGIANILVFILFTIETPSMGDLMPYAALVVMLIVTALLTGALHLDGFADCLDCLGSGKQGGAALEVMKDSRLGTMGVLGIVFDILLRFVILAALSDRRSESDFIIFFCAVVLAPCIAKAAIALACKFNRYARPVGASKPVVDDCTWADMLLNLAFVLLIAWGVMLFSHMFTPAVFIAAVPSVILGFLFSKIMAKRLGGINGDVLGASNEIAEISFLFILLYLRYYA